MNAFVSILFLFSSLWLTYGASSVPTGFGRFGRYNNDGLLTLNVTPYGFEAPSPMTPLSIRFAEGPFKVNVERINPTEKIMEIRSDDPASPKAVHYTLLYPGFSAIFGKKAVFHISGSRIRVEEPQKNPLRKFHFFLITPDQGECMPVMFAFRENFKPQTWELSPLGSGYRLAINANEPIREIRFITPIGMKEMSAQAPESERASLWTQAEFWAGCGIPEMLMKSYEYDRDKALVTIHEDFNTTEGQVISPIPPVLAFAIAMGYPAQVHGSIVQTNCITKYGPFAYVNGNKLTCSLPVPPMEERGYIRMKSSQDRINLLNSLVGHLGGDWATNAVDLGYAGMANAQMAWVYLDQIRRQNLINAWKKYLPMAFLFPPYPPDYAKNTWKEETEPFTGLSFVWTYQLSGPPPDNYRLDIDWGNALPLYGVCKYAQYTGDWDFVRINWDKILRIFRYFDFGDDWAWMTVVNGDMGWSTGTGDPMAASFCAHVACLKMAHTLGDRNWEDYFAYKTARVSVPTVARFWYNAWAREKGFVSQYGMVQGFWEQETFTCSQMGEQRGDPWGPTNILSGDGILPELFAALVRYAEPALKAYEQEYSSFYPHWAEGSYSYPFETTYDGNSVYVTFPHIYARAILGESTPTLWNYVDQAKTNPGSANWVGPNVIAELLSRDAPIILTEWQPLEYNDGYLKEDGKTVVLEFSQKNKTDWIIMGTVKGSLAPAQVMLNGNPVSFEYASGMIRIPGHVRGDIKIEISFN